MSVDIFFSFDILMSAMVLLLLGNAPVYRFTNSKQGSHTAALRSLISRLVAKQRIELNPREVRLRDIGNVAAGTLSRARLRRCLLVRHRMMAKSEEPPAIRLGESLAVLHRHVDAVELAVEEPAS